MAAAPVDRRAGKPPIPIFRPACQPTASLTHLVCNENLDADLLPILPLRKRPRLPLPPPPLPSVAAVGASMKRLYGRLVDVSDDVLAAAQRILDAVEAPSAAHVAACVSLAAKMIASRWQVPGLRAFAAAAGARTKDVADAEFSICVSCDWKLGPLCIDL